MFGMAWLLLAALVVVGTDAQFPIRCGKTAFPNLEQTVGVSEAKPLSWPWQISIRSASNRSHLCGGSLISEDYVITSASCVEGVDFSDVFMIAGIHRKDYFEHWEQVRVVSRVWPHENYNPKTLDNDIALIQLDKPYYIDYYYVDPVCLPLGEITTPGTQMWATGWRYLPYMDDQSPLLQAMLPFVDRSTCQSKYGSSITDSMLCAGNRPGDNVCLGDRGGPLVSQRKNGIWELIGISSWIPEEKCENNTGVYTDVKMFNTWIIEKATQVTAEKQLVSQRSFRPIPAGVAFRTMRGKVTEDESPKNDVDIAPAQE